MAGKSAPIPGDIDGDGQPDVVVGEHGGAKVFYTHAKPQGSFQQLIVTGQPSAARVVTGDFNGDGYSDLAIGLPAANEGAGGVNGQVVLYYGGPQGLSVAHPTYLDGHGGEQFGYYIQAVDLNRDGKTDLIVGQINGQDFVLKGAAKGISTKPRKPFVTNDFRRVAVGDLNGDGRPDLAVGVAGGKTQAGTGGSITAREGQVKIFYGGKRGFAKKPSVISGRKAGVGYGSLGVGLSIGKVNGDKYADLVAGAPGDTGTTLQAGAVAVFYGSRSGVSAKRDTVYRSGKKGVPGKKSSSGDQFGEEVVTGDINGDGRDDVIIGSPGEGSNLSHSGGANEGDVIVLRGSNHGVTTKHAQLIVPTDITADLTYGATTSYHFGDALAIFRTKGSRSASVLVGAAQYAPPTSATASYGFVDEYAGGKHGLDLMKGEREVGDAEGEFFGESVAP